MSKNAVVIGAGLAGLSAAIELVKKGCRVILVSAYPSERAQSTMAEGGINGALDTKGENDSPEEHAEETLMSAAGLADEQAVRNMTAEAPGIIEWLCSIGVVFNRQKDGRIELRSFGGQKKKRAAFVSNNTGKQIMTALIDTVRKEEIAGNVRRYFHHEFYAVTGSKRCTGCIISDRYTGKKETIQADAVIIACGGYHGLFGRSTGNLMNTGAAVSVLFSQGVSMSDLEMIQYHPTTVNLNSRQFLISEAVRAEGGRIYRESDGEKVYFLEDRYPGQGNLVPRDIASREIWHESKKGRIYIDMTILPHGVWRDRLHELRKDLMLFLEKDPKLEPLEIEPGLHYFMGGIYVDRNHRTNISGLYAAGECCAQYHGANRLGGNSLLGAVYGGMVAARSAAGDDGASEGDSLREPIKVSSYDELCCLRDINQQAMGVVRDENTLASGISCTEKYSSAEALFSRAMIMSAMERRESRGAHMREDYPGLSEEFRKVSVAHYDGENITVTFTETGKGDMLK